MTPDLEAAALDALVGNGIAHVYTKGYEAGLAATQTTELELPAGGYTPTQQARADATHTAAGVLAATIDAAGGVPIAPSDGDEPDITTVAEIAEMIIRMAVPLAAFIEHGTLPADFDRHVDEALATQETPTQT